MDNILMILFVAIAIIWLARALFRKAPSDELGIDGELIWVDRGKDTKPFFNHTYRVLGKPDLMYRVDGGILAVEYKSRKRSIYNSDVIQGLTACLAARGQGHKVSSLLIKTDGSDRRIELPKSDKQLYKKIEANVEMVRAAKQGKQLRALPAKYKCQYCAYTEVCDKAH